MEISNKLKAIKPSATLAISSKAKAMKAAGEDVVSLAAGEPDFNPPTCAIEAVRKALDEGRSRYTPAVGLPELREAVAAHLKDFFGYDVAAENVVLSAGGKQAVHNCLHSVIEPGDEVLLMSPWWVSYWPLIELSGGIPVEVPKAENGFLDIDLLEKHVTDKTKMIVLNSPSNPSGAVISKEELDALEAFVLKHDLLILSDELYSRLVYKGEHVSPMGRSTLIDRTLMVGGFSKCYAMTGWRLGFSVTPAHVAKAIGAYQSHLTSNPNSLAQYAALASLKDADADLKTMWNAFNTRRKLMHELLNSIPGVSCDEPEGAFYAFPDVRELLKARGFADDLEFCTFVLEKLKVAVIPGSAFGAPGFVRMSYATSEGEINRAIDRLKEEFC